MNKKLSDFIKDNENFASLKKDFEDRLKIGTRFDSMANFLEAEKKRIKTEYSKQSISVTSPGIVADFEYTKYLRFSFDTLDRGKDYLIEDILKSAREDYENIFKCYPEVIKHDLNSGEFEKGVLQNLSNGVGLLLYRKFLISVSESESQKRKFDSNKNKPQTLKEIFISEDAFNDIMKRLSDNGFTDEELWVEKRKGYKSIIIALIYHLGSKGYYKDGVLSIPDNSTIQSIAKDTFGVEIKVDTIKGANREGNNISELRKKYFSFIETYKPA